jgi:hypothetical protein
MADDPRPKPHSLQIKALLHHFLVISMILGSLYAVAWFLDDAAVRFPSHKSAFEAIATIDTYAMIGVAGLFAMLLVVLVAIYAWKSIRSTWKGEE